MFCRITYAPIGLDSENTQRVINAKRTEIGNRLREQSGSENVAISTSRSRISTVIVAEFTSPASKHDENELKAMLQEAVDQHIESA